MDRQTSKTLNQRLLNKFLCQESEFADHEIKVPAKSFYDPMLFQKEKETFFLNAPQPIAFSAEISESNSFLSMEIMGTPIVLTRNQKGTLKAFLNACPHRGGKIACGTGQKKLLTCGFHGWSFTLDGDLAMRPQEACFTTDKSELGLIELPVNEESGIIILGMAKNIDVSPAGAGYEAIAQEISHYNLKTFKRIDRFDCEVAANWKLIVDLSLESYHFSVLHRESVATVLSSSSIFDTYERASRWAFPWLTIERLAELEETDWPDALEGSCTYTLYPGVMVIVNASGAQMIRAEPGDNPNHTRISFVGLYHPDSNEADARQGYEFGKKVFIEEDLKAAIECQRGLEATQRDLIIGTNEPLLQFWHNLWQHDLHISSSIED
ncbi:MAG: aromatic ring-hydroxylating oxygenase subunit alpha [Parvibaculales bacterium]